MIICYDNKKKEMGSCNNQVARRIRFGQLLIVSLLLGLLTTESSASSTTASNIETPLSSRMLNGQALGREVPPMTTESIQSSTLRQHYAYEKAVVFSVRGGGEEDDVSSSVTEMDGGAEGEEGNVSEEAEPQAQDTTATTATSEGDDGSVELDSQDNAARDLATKLRLQGKEFHDNGDFVQAANLFQQAADTLLPVLLGASQKDGGHSATSTTNAMIDEYATCRLHEALCHLKGEKYDMCIAACTTVLQDGASDETGEEGGEKGDYLLSSQSRSILSKVSSVVRARAFHRRAKAKLALDDKAGALQDARSAAFLGDRKAVAFYGRLMRDSPSSSSSFAGSGSSPSGFESLFSPSSSNGGSLLESLLSKSSSNGGAKGPSSLLGEMSPAFMLNALQSKRGKGELGGGLASSVLKNLGKRLEDESTHNTICQYLHGTSKAQLEQLAAMAGVSPGGNGMFTDEQIEKVVEFCHGVTPKTIRTTVRTTKRTIYGVQVVRRILKVLSKYKSIIAALILLQWSKSAMLRPLPVNKRAAKQALKQAMKENRAKPPNATNK